MKRKYAVRLIGANENIRIHSTAPDMEALQSALNRFDYDLVRFDSEKFGEIIVNRQHIVMIQELTVDSQL